MSQFTSILHQSEHAKHGDKIHYVSGTTFTLSSTRFSDLKAIGQQHHQQLFTVIIIIIILIGKGSYGIVCSAYDSILCKRIAIKKITPMASSRTDAKHVLREIRLLRHLGKHENIVTLEDLIINNTDSNTDKDELYIVLELLDSDLHKVLQSKQQLTEQHYKYFFFQLLNGVKYLHDNRIIHRDLKPGNLLVTKDCRLRITDFGLARERPIGTKGLDAPDEDISQGMTQHVVTRWYRPCELMLCPDGLYTYAIDCWSCGCILAEMLGRAPIFPGTVLLSPSPS